MALPLFAALLTFLASSGTAATEPIYNPANGHYYEAVAENITWPQAQDAAAARTYKGVKGHLATITSSAENQFVVSHFLDQVNVGYYLGGEQGPGSEEPGGGWRWITGEAWNYTNWHSGEPNNTDNSNFLAFIGDGNGTWNDIPDWVMQGGYVVEYDTPAPDPQDPLVFTDPVLVSTGAVGRGAGFPVPTDLDKDGHLDLVLSVNNGIVLLFGRGDGTFATPIYKAVAGGETYETDVADLNNDGKPDVMLVCSGQNNVAILYNTGGRTLAAPIFVSVGTRPFGVEAVDLNEDGWLDLAVTNHEDHNFSTLLNLKDETFGPRNTYGAGDYTSLPTHGDYNRDGHQDVVIPNYVPGNYNIYFGDGAGGFSSGDNDRLGDYVAQMATDDFNRDGILDLVSANMYSNSVTILKGDGDGKFSQHTTYGAGQYPHVLRTGDLDGDGAPDVIIPNAGTGFMTILRNTGAGFFTPAGPYFMVGRDARYAAVADFNEDGRPDFLTTSNEDDKIAIRFNLTGPARITAPDSLTARIYAPRQVELRWNDRTTAETGYKVYRRVAGETTFPLVATLGKNVQVYREGPLGFQTYEYIVRASLNDTVSAPSNIAVVTVPALPGTPANFTVTVNPTAKGIEVQWTDQQESTAEQYEVRRSTGGSDAFVRRAQVPADNSQPVNSYSYSETSIAQNTVYSYYIRALNSTGGTNSAVKTVTSSGLPKPATNLTATTPPQGGLITLTWREASPNETEFEIWRATPGAVFSRYDSVAANTTQFVDRQTAHGVTYRYYVVARNGWGPAAPSNTATVTVPTSPPIPTGLTARAAPLALRIDLAWQDTTNETGYEVWRKDGPANTTGDFVLRVYLPANAKSYQDTASLTPGATYTYFIVAYNLAGPSNPSSKATATLDATPTAPQGFSASPVRKKKRLLLQWQDATGEGSYEVWRKPGSLAQPGTYTRLNTVAAGTVRYVDTRVQWKRRYSYYVVAVNSLGSVPSNKDDAKVSSKP